MRKRITTQFMQMWVHLKSWKQHPSQTILRLSFVVGVIVFGFGIGLPSVHAQVAQVATDAVQGFMDVSLVNWTFDRLILGISKILFALANFAIALTIFCLKFFIALASYNNFSQEAVVVAGWTLVRDVANMFFIVALLVIAFATVLGQESYAMKKTLGKVVLMAILINFSKLITQLILDVIHVFSMTFVNAISATAGGNVIKLLKLSEIRSIANAGLEIYSEIAIQLIVTALFAIAMSVIAMFSMLTYAVVLLYRMVLLWVLIILSPVAFAMQSLPATSKFAKEWWGEFTKNALSLPVMVLFMWLAFATLGTGTGLEGIVGSDALSTDARAVVSTVGRGASPTLQPLTLSDATTWTNLAGFAVVIAFLFAGIEQVQKLSVRGFDEGKKFAKFTMNKAPIIGGDKWARRGKNIAAYAKLRNLKRSEMQDKFFDDLGSAPEEWTEKIGDRVGGKTGAVLKFAGKRASGMLRMGVTNRLKSNTFREKEAEDIQKAAKSQEYIYDEAISSGKTFVGRVKLDANVEEDSYKKLAPESRRRKMAKHSAKVMGKRSIRERITGGGLSARLKDQNKETIERKQAANVFEGRVEDIAAIERGDVPTHENAANAKNFEEMSEQYKNMSEKAMVGNASRLAAKMNRTRDPNAKQELNNKLKALIAVAMKKGSETGMAVLKAASVEAGATGNIQSNDLGARVDQMKAIFGEEGETSTPEFAALISAFHHAAGDGAVPLAGLIKENIDDETGESTYEWSDAAASADRSYYAGMQKYFAERVGPRKAQAVSDMVTVKYGPPPGSPLGTADSYYQVVETDQDKANLMNTLGTLKANHGIEGALKNDIKKLIATTNAQAVAAGGRAMSEDDFIEMLKTAVTVNGETYRLPDAAADALKAAIITT